MRVGIDVHAIGKQLTGNETYIRNLVENLSMINDKEKEFVFYHTLSASDYTRNGWNGEVKRIRPNSPFIRIPISFPYVLKRDKIDLAHFQYVIPPVSPCRTLVSIHDISFEFLPDCFGFAERTRMKLLVPLSARRADHIMTISEYSKQQIVERYNIPEEKVTVKYIGVSDKFRPADTIEIMKIKLALDIHHPYILGVGNLQPRKNLNRLIEAFADIKKRHAVPHQLVLVGKKAWRGQEILDYVDQLGVSDDVLFTGYLQEQQLITLYSGAELFVYPSIYEGFGLPVIEAMACGVPVVTSNLTSLPEVAGDSAIQIDPYDTDALARAMLQVLDDKQLQQSMINSGLLHSKKFSWHTFAQDVNNIYEQVMN